MMKEIATSYLKNMVIIRKVIFLFMIFSMPSSAYAKDLKTIRQAEKISLSLSGDLMSDEERLKIFNGSLSLDKLVDIKLSSSGFNQKFAEYWARKLGVTVSLDAYG
jgi:hypothetical protein